MSFENSLLRINGTFTFKLIDLSKSSIVLFSIDLIIKIPAQLIKILIEANFLRTCLISSKTFSSLSRFTGNVSIAILVLIFLKFFFNFSSFVLFVDVRNRLQESVASCFEISSPIPPVAPVIKQFFFFRILVFIYLQSVKSCSANSHII